MRHSQRLIALVGSALVIAVLAAGCGGSSSDSSSTAAATTGGGETQSSAVEGKTVAVLSLVPNEADQCMDETMESTFGAAGMNVKLYHSNFEPATSNQNIQDAITQQVDGAVYKSQSEALDESSIAELEKAGIPTVFTLGPKTGGTQPQVTMPPLSQKGGEEAIDELLKQRPEVTKVGLITGPQGVAVIEEAIEGFEAGLARHGLKAEVIEEGDLTSQGGSQVSQDMLQAHPDLEAIVTIGDDMALAAARVAASSPGKPVVVDTYGFSSDALKAVKSGELLAVIYSPLDVWSEEMAKSLIAVMSNEPVEKVIPLSLQTLDASNVSKVKSSC